MRDKAIDGANDGRAGWFCRSGKAVKNKKSVNRSRHYFRLGRLWDAGSENLEGDWWGLGSQYWAKCVKENYQADYGILLDMVGE